MTHRYRPRSLNLLENVCQECSGNDIDENGKLYKNRKKSRIKINYNLRSDEYHRARPGAMKTHLIAEVAHPIAVVVHTGALEAHPVDVEVHSIATVAHPAVRSDLSWSLGDPHPVAAVANPGGSPWSRGG
jgi:hypothetical protein